MSGLLSTKVGWLEPANYSISSYFDKNYSEEELAAISAAGLRVVVPEDPMSGFPDLIRVMVPLSSVQGDVYGDKVNNLKTTAWARAVQQHPKILEDMYDVTAVDSSTCIINDEIDTYVGLLVELNEYGKDLLKKQFLQYLGEQQEWDRQRPSRNTICEELYQARSSDE